MKALRIFAFAAFLAVGSAIVPQTASAYKYYVTFSDGTQVCFHSASKENAKKYFDTHFGSDTVLTSRPGGGFLKDHF